MLPRLTTLVWIGAGTLVYPTSMGIHKIGSQSGSIGPQEFSNAQPLESSINEIYAKHRDPATTLSKVIGRKLSHRRRLIAMSDEPHA